MSFLTCGVTVLLIALIGMVIMLIGIFVVLLIKAVIKEW